MQISETNHVSSQAVLQEWRWRGISCKQ